MTNLLLVVSTLLVTNVSETDNAIRFTPTYTDAHALEGGRHYGFGMTSIVITPGLFGAPATERYRTTVIQRVTNAVCRVPQLSFELGRELISSVDETFRLEPKWVYHSIKTNDVHHSRQPPVPTPGNAKSRGVVSRRP